MLFRRQEPVLRHYVSESGYFFRTFDRTPEAHSVSRRYEEEKHKRIAEARDNPMAIEPVKQIWEDF
jgi:hypothetical protein